MTRSGNKMSAPIGGIFQPTSPKKKVGEFTRANLVGPAIEMTSLTQFYLLNFKIKSNFLKKIAPERANLSTLATALLRLS